MAFARLTAVLALTLLSTFCGGEVRDVMDEPTPPTSVTEAGIAPAGSRFSDDPLGRFRKRAAMGYVRKLATRIGVRVRATSGERRGATYVRKKLEGYGYTTRMQRFSVDDGTSRNVVAWWPGARRHGIVMGGHMDSVPGSPGANDNASGTAVILEMARLAAGRLRLASSASSRSDPRNTEPTVVTMSARRSTSTASVIGGGGDSPAWSRWT